MANDDDKLPSDNFVEAARKYRVYLRRREDTIARSGEELLRATRERLDAIQVPRETGDMAPVDHDYYGTRHRLCVLLEAVAIYAFQHGIDVESVFFFAGQRVASVRARLAPTCCHPATIANGVGNRYCLSCYAELG